MMATAFKIYNTASGRAGARFTWPSQASEYRAGEIGHGRDNGDLDPYIR